MTGNPSDWPTAEHLDELERAAAIEKAESVIAELDDLGEMDQEIFDTWIREHPEHPAVKELRAAMASPRNPRVN